VGVNLETVSEAGRRNGTVKSNDEAFEALFAAEYSRVTGIANRVLADSHEAEDVAWLYRAAAHKALNRVRGRRRRERRELSQATDEGASTMDPQHVLETSEDRRMVRQALARLSTKPATVLVLRASGLSYAEVAQALGVGIGQIGTLLRRAEAALRKEVTRGTSL
jgi:DNA-directed RNA polymerase specialized sigma24 family protein